MPHGCMALTQLQLLASQSSTYTANNSCFCQVRRRFFGPRGDHFCRGSGVQTHRNPPTGSRDKARRDRAAGEGLGAKPPEGDESLQILTFEKYFVCHAWCQSKSVHICKQSKSTQICIQNVGLQTFCEFTNRRNESDITCDIIQLKPHRSLAK